MNSMEDKQWGGARKGAGRKPADPDGRRVQMVITIEPSTRARLKALARKEDVAVGRLLDKIFGSVDD